MFIDNIYALWNFYDLYIKMIHLPQKWYLSNFNNTFLISYVWITFSWR